MGTPLYQFRLADMVYFLWPQHTTMHCSLLLKSVRFHLHHSRFWWSDFQQCRSRFSWEEFPLQQKLMGGCLDSTAAAAWQLLRKVISSTILRFLKAIVKRDCQKWGSLCLSSKTYLRPSWDRDFAMDSWNKPDVFAYEAEHQLAVYIKISSSKPDGALSLHDVIHLRDHLIVFQQ